MEATPYEPLPEGITLTETRRPSALVLPESPFAVVRLIDDGLGRNSMHVRPSPSHTMSKQELLESFDDRQIQSSLQTDSQTVLNTINLYVGVGLLSMGYAVKLGGWASLVVLAVSTFVFSWTAKLICYAFDELPPGVVHSYPNLGRAALGAPGQWLVMGAMLVEFWGALGMCLIVLWQNLAMLLLPAGALFCLPGAAAGSSCLSASQVAIILSTVVVLPAIWIRSFSKLTSISLPVVVVAYAIDPSSALVVPPEEAHSHTTADWAHLPMAAGIFIVSLSGHAGLPSLRRGMAHPAHFERCINITFSCMFLLYATMGGVAYLYFGEAVQVLVTGSLNASSSVAGLLLLKLGPFSLSLSQALTLLVALSVYSTIPVSMAEPLVRTGVVAVGYFTAISAYNVLSHVESLVGGLCSVTVSLLLPALIFYKLRAGRLHKWQEALLVGLIVLGFLAAVGITTINVLDLAGK
eukprot:jgi/Mesen1/4215/ME000219S03339